MVTITLQKLREIQASVENAESIAARVMKLSPANSPEGELAYAVRSELTNAIGILNYQIKAVSESVELEIEA